MRAFSKRDKKLSIVSVFAAICHREHSSSSESQSLMKLVFKRCPINRLSTSSSTCGVSSLNHKPGNHAMKNSAIIIAIKCQLYKIATGKWSFFGPKFNLYFSISGNHYNFRSCWWFIFGSDGVFYHFWFVINLDYKRLCQKWSLFVSVLLFGHFTQHFHE